MSVSGCVRIPQLFPFLCGGLQAMGASCSTKNYCCLKFQTFPMVNETAFTGIPEKLHELLIPTFLINVFTGNFVPFDFVHGISRIFG